ncbi:aldehyde dehydrogenase family protein [Sinirhodobacter populi]|uniref:Aldehyde dehydrogenase family protein n=1 Tax=Paenirhodobacter populi TaxID=2306993 RepID=A0A443JKG9_9RHOB|nr:aldehyde dehydrogenase family protein [Sinirhodobacter populi]
MLATLLTEADVPPGDVNVVTSSATSEVVDVMIDDLRVWEISFIGATSVGRISLRKAADQVLNCSMELGSGRAAVRIPVLPETRAGGEMCRARSEQPGWCRSR